MNENAILSAGNERAKEQFIKEHKQFIAGCIRRATHRFVTESDDEWSVGLVAFSEAVDSYHPDKGNFSSYAYMVISRRLTDHYRRGVRATQEVKVSPHVFTGDVEDAEDSGVMYAVQAAVQPPEEKASLQDELEEANAYLKDYGFTFFDLTAVSPQTGKTRKACVKAAACVLQDSALLEAMRRKHTLPMRALTERTGVSAKLLERHRKYIIAVVVLMQGEYPFLQEYLHAVKEEMRT